MTDPLHAEALDTFGRLLAEATASGMADPNAMALATADADGMPAVRTVLLKSFDAHGFVFYTHLDSAKGRDLGEFLIPGTARLTPKPVAVGKKRVVKKAKK